MSPGRSVGRMPPAALVTSSVGQPRRCVRTAGITTGSHSQPSYQCRRPQKTSAVPPRGPSTSSSRPSWPITVAAPKPAISP